MFTPTTFHRVCECAHSREALLSTIAHLDHLSCGIDLAIKEKRSIHEFECCEFRKPIIFWIQAARTKAHAPERPTVPVASKYNGLYIGLYKFIPCQQPLASIEPDRPMRGAAWGICMLTMGHLKIPRSEQGLLYKSAGALFHF